MYSRNVPYFDLEMLLIPLPLVCEKVVSKKENCSWRIPLRQIARKHPEKINNEEMELGLAYL